jgi:hypothetical protein
VDDRANEEACIAEMITAATRFTGTANTEAYGKIVAQLLLPDLLPYKVGTPPGFPTGLTSAMRQKLAATVSPYVVASTPSA